MTFLVLFSENRYKIPMGGLNEKDYSSFISASSPAIFRTHGGAGEDTQNMPAEKVSKRKRRGGAGREDPMVASHTGEVSDVHDRSDLS